jgi:glyoxylase-like metal-dependent hydrolase (beta-lactamase superfamily II)
MARFTKITDGVYMLSNVVVNQYFVEGEDGLTLIDTGLPGNFGVVDAALARLGRVPSELERILITHADADHYGATMQIAAVSGATIFASPVEAEAIRAGRSSRALKPRGFEALFYGLVAPMFRTGPVLVDETLNPGDSIAGLKVIASPGHTPGHISFYLPEKKVLFAGDSIRIVRGKPLASTGANTWDRDLAQHTFRKQMELRPELEHLCCGHGYLHLTGEEY